MSNPIIIEGFPDGLQYSGNVDFTPAQLFATNVRIASGASNGYVLTSNGSGDASWAANTPLIAGGWTDAGSVIYPTTSTDAVVVGGTSASGTELLRVLNGAVLFDGATGAVPVSGSGTRMFWAPAKLALRAGSVTGTQWDNANVGSNSTAFGADVTASASFSTALGRECVANRYGEIAFSGSNIATDGDAQCSLVVFSNQTTDATPTEIFLDGVTASQRFTIADDTTAIFDVNIAATDNTDNYLAVARIALRRGTGVANTTLLASDLTKIAGSGLSWAFTPTADITNGALRLTVTGEAGKTINWCASARVTSVSL